MQNRYYRLGMALCDWHASGSDPIYAVGSTMIAGKFDPKTYDRQIIIDAARNLRQIKDEDADTLAKRLDNILNRSK